MGNRQIRSIRAPFTPATPAALTDTDLPSIVVRHPLRPTDLPGLFAGWQQVRIDARVSHLLADGRVQLVERGGESFLVGAELRLSPLHPVAFFCLF